MGERPNGVGPGTVCVNSGKRKTKNKTLLSFYSCLNIPKLPTSACPRFLPSQHLSAQEPSLLLQCYLLGPKPMAMTVGTPRHHSCSRMGSASGPITARGISTQAGK